MEPEIFANVPTVHGVHAVAFPEANEPTLHAVSVLLEQYDPAEQDCEQGVSES